MTKPKKIAAIIVAGLFVYLSLYTWNLRTGHLDALSAYTGLDITGWIVRPGHWVTDRVSDFWGRYIYLVGLRQENERLQEANARLRLKNLMLSDRADATARLERLLQFAPLDNWSEQGARIIAHRMGPVSSLETVIVDRGSLAGVQDDMPVVSLDGVVGRVLRYGATASHVLLLSDPNSRVSVIGKEKRSQGIVVGQGSGQDLKVEYIKLNSPIEPGELLETSGLAGIFPKGLPVARVKTVHRSDISLFLSITAEPLVDVGGLEEVLLLKRMAGPGENNATSVN